MWIGYREPPASSWWLSCGRKRDSFIASEINYLNSSAILSSHYIVLFGLLRHGAQLKSSFRLQPRSSTLYILWSSSGTFVIQFAYCIVFAIIRNDIIIQLKLNTRNFVLYYLILHGQFNKRLRNDSTICVGYHSLLGLFFVLIQQSCKNIFVTISTPPQNNVTEYA